MPEDMSYTQILFIFTLRNSSLVQKYTPQKVASNEIRNLVVLGFEK